MSGPEVRRIFQQWRHLALTLVVVIAASLLWWRMGTIYQSRLINEQRAAQQANTDDIAALLTSDINRRQAQLVGLAAAVKSHTTDELREEHFEVFAAGLKADDPVIRTIQFFPPQGLMMVYPIKGNEAVAGSTLEDLRSTDRAVVREDVERAIATGQITLSKPYELRQGGKGVVARLAVYDNNTFLGLAVIILNMEPLLNVPGFENSSDQIRFAIRDDQGQVFYGEEGIFSEDPVQARIILPDGSWTIGAVPAAGWGAHSKPVMRVFTLIGALLVSLLGGITYLVSSSQATLKRVVTERTADLAASEERYATALKMVNEGIWDWDLETRTGFASYNAFALLGYPEGRRDISLAMLRAHLHPDDFERIIADLQSRIESGESFNIEMHMRKLDGSWIYAMIRGRVVERDASGLGRRLAGTILDITEQKQAEMILREGQSKFQALFENNHAAMLLIRPESGEIVDANPAACAFYGWSRSEMTGKLVSQINILSQDEVLTEMKRAVQVERRYFQFRHRLANQEIRDVEVFSGPIEHNGKTLLYSIIHDVTVRKQAERALEESEERYRQLLLMAPVGITVYSDGCFRFINPAGARLLGAESGEQLVGKTIEDLVFPERIPETRLRMEKFMASKGGVFKVENVFVRMDGSPIPVELVIAQMIYQGKPAFQIVISDITERKKSEEKIQATQNELQRLLAEADRSRLVLLSVIEDQKIAEEKLSRLNVELEQRVAERTAQLVAANRELEAFSYSVSHDLRAPLRGIDGWSQALLEDFGGQLEEKGQEYIERVRSETQRMGELIDDLLRLSRVTRVEMKRVDVVLSDVAQKIAARLQEENPQRQVAFHIQPGVCGQGDANLLEIVLTNLLSNAFKFTSKQAQARIEFGQEVHGSVPVYYVRDNGAGFDMNFAKNLFGAFQRMHKQTEFPGTGVGLATVQRIIHRHGGKVWVDAQKNQGATFYFTLLEDR